MRLLTLLLLLVLPIISRAEDDGDFTRIAFGSCANENEPQPIWWRIIEDKPDAFVFLGDNIYADVEKKSDFATNYKKLGEKPGFKKLRQTVPILATWDDHDYGRNNAGADFRMKEAGREAFFKFFEVPKDSPRRKRSGIYDAAYIKDGEHTIQVLLLDTRWNRSPVARAGKDKDGRPTGKVVPNTDPKATMLGEEQWTWLETELRKPADLRLLCSSIQFISESGGEVWANFPRERARMLKLIRDTKAGRVVILSGDRHFGEVSALKAGKDALPYPLLDVTSSGLTRGHDPFRTGGANRHRMAILPFGDNYGLIEVQWQRKDPLIATVIKDVEGRTAIRYEFPLKTLEAGGQKKE